MINLEASQSSSGKFAFEESPHSASRDSRQSRRQSAYTYEDGKLLENGKPLKAFVHCSEMTPEMESWAVDCAAIALLNSANRKEAAAYIKKQFDKQFGPSWQCVVGTSFGSYVSHFEGAFIYFMFKDMTVLLFQI